MDSRHAFAIPVIAVFLLAMTGPSDGDDVKDVEDVEDGNDTDSSDTVTIEIILTDSPDS